MIGENTPHIFCLAVVLSFNSVKTITLEITGICLQKIRYYSTKCYYVTIRFVMWCAVCASRIIGPTFVLYRKFKPMLHEMKHRDLNTCPITRTSALLWRRSEKDGIQGIAFWVSPAKLRHAVKNVFGMCYACLREEENRCPVHALNVVSKNLGLTITHWTKTVQHPL
jgi:hypothetical protein